MNYKQTNRYYCELEPSDISEKFWFEIIEFLLRTRGKSSAEEGNVTFHERRTSKHFLFPLLQLAFYSIYQRKRLPICQVIEWRKKDVECKERSDIFRSILLCTVGAWLEFLKALKIFWIHVVVITVDFVVLLFSFLSVSEW